MFFIDDHTHISTMPRSRGDAMPATFMTPEHLIDMYDEVGIQ